MTLECRYGPPRDTLAQAWGELKGQGPWDVDRVAAAIHRGLDLLSGQPLQDDWKVWTSNCGRGVSRHMGPHDLPKRMGLVRPDTAKPKARGQAKQKAKGLVRTNAQRPAKSKGHLQLVASGRKYVKCPLTPCVRQRLQQHIELGTLMAKCKAAIAW